MKQFKAIVIGLALCLVLGAGVEAFASSQGQVKRQKKEAPAPKKEEKKPAPENSKLAPTEQVVNISIDSYGNLVVSIDNVTFKMIKVQGGTFTMGATPEQQYPDSDEKPVFQVTLIDYWLGETEVTQALWKAVMGSNPSKWKGDNLPVEMVSWDECQEFIRKLNELTDEDFRLPTEAEWEFAARGGCNSRGYQYSGSNNIGDVAWYTGNSGDKTHPVATKAANELGIYDMSGNVWEWCQDWYGDYSSYSQNNPTGPASGFLRVYRGGSWYSIAWYCRSASRIGRAPDERGSNLGLRLGLSHFKPMEQ